MDIARLDVRPEIGILNVDQYAQRIVRIGSVLYIMDCVKRVSKVIGEVTATKLVQHFVTYIYAANIMVHVIRVVSWENMATYATKYVVQDV